MIMRKSLKILHTLAACGMVGAVLAYMVLLLAAPQDTATAYAELRQSIAALCDYLLLPSLALVLVSGLLSMAVHRPFLDKRWAWLKAALGLVMFKSVLTVVGAKAEHAAVLSAEIARGEAAAAMLERALAHEWDTLLTILALSLANIVLGVWRPGLRKQGSGSFQVDRSQGAQPDRGASSDR